MDVTGADGGTRTRNLLFTKQLLYQLSYVGATGRALPQKTLRRRGMIGRFAGMGQAWGVWGAGAGNSVRSRFAPGPAPM